MQNNKNENLITVEHRVQTPYGTFRKALSGCLKVLGGLCIGVGIFGLFAGGLAGLGFIGMGATLLGVSKGVKYLNTCFCPSKKEYKTEKIPVPNDTKKIIIANKYRVIINQSAIARVSRQESISTNNNADPNLSRPDSKIKRLAKNNMFNEKNAVGEGEEQKPNSPSNETEFMPKSENFSLKN